MIQKLTNDYKYRPHVILGSLAIAVVITSLATGALIALHGDIQNAFKHQHIAMLCLCSAEAAAFTSFCLLAVARLRMKHNYAEDAEKLLTTPHELIRVEPLQCPLPKPLMGIVFEYTGDREPLILCLKFGIPITNKKYYEKWKRAAVQLCAYNDQHKRYFTPFYRGIMGVLSYQNLSLDKAVATLKQHKKLYDEDGHGFALAANLLLGPHDKKPLLSETKPFVLDNLGQCVIKCNDIYTVELFLKNSCTWIDTSCVERYANEATALLLLKNERMTRELDEMMHHACLMGWSEFVDEFFRLQPYKSDRFFKTCWQSVFAGAFYRQQLLSSKPPDQEEIFRGIRNVYVGDGQKIHYLRRCEQIKSGKHCEIAKTLLKQGKGILREVDCREFNGLDLQSLPILQFVETFHLQDFIEFFAPKRARLLDPKEDRFVYFD